ncbi:MAG: hypothetical protein WBV94_29515 [Blastocatellia bacterium]
MLACGDEPLELAKKPSIKAPQFGIPDMSFAAFRALRDISNSTGVRGPFNEMPRFPFQVGESLLRTTRFLMRLPELRRERLRNLNAQDSQ